MAFTPNEIRNKEFTRVKNGLEPAEVSDFLTQLSNEIERLKEEKIFRSRFRMLVEAQLDLLKNDDWDYLLNYDFDAEQVTQENIQHLNPQDVNPNANSETPTSETTETLSNEENQSINSNETTNTNKSTSENKDVSSSESSSNK